MNIVERILDNGERYPERIVMISGDKKLTYGELINWSGKIASYIETNADSKSPVMVYGHKDVLMLPAFLGCIRSGRAYCPVDSSTPAERVRDIADSIDNPMILATEELTCLDEERFHIISKDKLREIAEDEGLKEIDPSLQVKEDDTYYIIFTSGSTGKPKGVEISCDALTFFAQWMTEVARCGNGSVFINQAPFSFDLSVMDTYSALYSAGTIFTLDKELQKDMGLMFEKMKESKANFWVSTPSFADLCMADQKFDINLLPELKAFLFCGEKLTKATARKLMERFPNVRIVNTYGPTESTVAVTDIDITAQMLEDEEELPIGIAKPGTEIVVDPANNELIIKGNTVSKGYFREPEKTAKVFGNENGIRTYRTGDAGFIKDGVIYYKGRIDRQIKLHGYRIELGDIEANIIDINGVEAACVLPEIDMNGKIKSLIAFVVKPDSEGGFAASKEIKGELKKRLPSYMVPKKIKFIDKMPVNQNGKADRKKLEEMLRKNSI